MGLGQYRSHLICHTLPLAPACTSCTACPVILIGHGSLTLNLLCKHILWRRKKIIFFCNSKLSLCIFECFPSSLLVHTIYGIEITEHWGHRSLLQMEVCSERFFIFLARWPFERGSAEKFDQNANVGLLNMSGDQSVKSLLILVNGVVWTRAAAVEAETVQIAATLLSIKDKPVNTLWNYCCSFQCSDLKETSTGTNYGWISHFCFLLLYLSFCIIYVYLYCI